MKRLKLSNLMMVVAVGLGGLVMTRGAEGSLIEFTFGGNLSFVSGTPPAPWDGIAVESEFLVTMVFDSETPDQDTSFQNGRYAVESLSVSLDGVALAAGFAEIILRRDDPFQHRYMVNFLDFPIVGSGGITLTGPFALDSDDLPTMINLNDWSVASTFGFVFMGSEIFGSVATFSSRIVPAPGSLLVVCFSLLGTPNRRRTPPI